jgi:hypothetical protein
MSTTETLTLETEADARPFYGKRVWVLQDGERVRRTIKEHWAPGYGERNNCVVLVARTNGLKTHLPLTIEI